MNAQRTPTPAGALGFCGRCGKPLERAETGPRRVSGAARCPGCGLLVPGVVGLLPGDPDGGPIPPDQVRPILVNLALRVGDLEQTIRRVAAESQDRAALVDRLVRRLEVLEAERERDAG